MVNPQSPFSFLDGLFDRLGSLQPPAWLVDEVQHRVVLFLNHVLQQEPEAMARLERQKGRVALVQWRHFTLRLLVTPAGLVDLASSAVPPDLTLTVTDESPFTLAQAAMRGEKPAVRIEGDVQFAAEINWLADNVRWDVAEDLSRLVGDTPAHYVSEAASRAAAALRQFVAGRGRPQPDGTDPHSSGTDRTP